MKKILKWIGIAVLGLVAVIAIMGAIIYVSTGRELNERLDIEPAALTIPEPDSAIIAHGHHVAQTRCFGCHGENLAGEIMVDDRAFGLISSSNLTSGKGGIGGKYSVRDWVRAIRDGVGADGRPLLIMPANEFVHLGREDLQAVIAYVKSTPPVDWTPPEQRVGPMARALYFFDDDFPLLNVRKVDHSIPIPEVPPREVTVEYGEYMVTACQGCHGADLTGGANGPPDVPPAANLTILQDWDAGDFTNAVRYGVRPTGDSLHAFMPRWKTLTDVEVDAIWEYVQTLKPQPQKGT